MSTSSTGNPQFRIFFGGPDFQPRTLRDLLNTHVSAVPSGSEIFWATYYFRDEALADALVQAKKRGVNIEILTHDTERRVSRWIENLLDELLVFRRYCHSQGLPMHNKFILIDSHQQREVIFDSMNLSQSSLHANHELLVISANKFLYDAFRDRWEQMVKETQEMPS